MLLVNFGRVLIFLPPTLDIRGYNVICLSSTVVLFMVRLCGVFCICIAWRNPLRKLWQVPSMAHGNVLALLSDSTPLDICLLQRFCNFCLNIEKQGSKLIKAVVKIALANHLSVFSNNCSKINSRYGSTSNAVKQSNDNWYSSISEDTMYNICVLDEMIEIRTGTKNCDIFRLEDAQYKFL